MADEDEVDVLGDFTFDNLFVKEESRISTCYDGGVLGAQGTDQLLHDCINPAWLLEPSQSCWFSPSHDDRQRTSPADERSALNFTSLGSASSPNWEEGDSWTEREKTLLDKGIELFGRSWSRVAQFVGSKSPQQVRCQARLMGITGMSSVSESSEHQEEEEPPMEVITKQPVSFNLSELIDDMAIPASMEEVIAVVTTAQPTVQSMCPSPPHKRQRHSSNEKGHRSVITTRGRGRGGRRGRPRKLQTSESRTISHSESDSELVIALPQVKESAVPIRFVSEGEELVRIQKENDSEDSVIDIDDVTSDNEAVHSMDISNIKQEVTEDQIKQEIMEELKQEIAEEDNAAIKENVKSEDKSCVARKPEALEKIFDLPIPKNPIALNPEIISEEEKDIHFEFFLGRPTKTPSRYLKIRNYIVDCWLQNKPKYISKTSVRSGLRNCGDVNCIGRVHAYLEMVGAINFGCEQTLYRPIIVPLTYARNGVGPSHIKIKTENKLNLPVISRAESRPRKKKIDFFDSDGEGGLTISHDAQGGVVYTEVHHEPKKEPRERKSAHEQLRLVHCYKFSDTKPAPYCVVLDIGALLLMDVHAHSCRSEVIGLLGGSFDTRSKVLHISRSIACKSQSTGVQCDMCPVSQTQASEQLQDAGLEVVGWYHSHPTFLSNPSLQDLDTQLKVQTWFDKTDAPFVGIIVSPYFQGNKTLASNLRCLIVREEDEERRPYQFPVTVSSSQTCSDTLVHRIAKVFEHLGQGPGSEIIPFNENTNLYPTTTYLEKLMESLKLHINQCQPSLSTSEEVNLISGIKHICQQFSSNFAC